MTFAEGQESFYGLGEDAWSSYRLFVDNRDVTTFRADKPGDPVAQIQSYQLVEPYGYGPATFALPMLTPFDYPSWGTGELKWMGNGKPVKLVQVDPSDSLVRTVWEGTITRPTITDTGTVIACDGLATGRLSRRIKTTGQFAKKKHVGRAIFDGFANLNMRITPYLGGDIGPKIVDRNMGEWWIDRMDDLLAATVDTDGSGYTIMPTTDGKWLLAEKDTTTVDFTIHYGAHGVKIDLFDDLTERPNTIYGQGVSPDNLVWNNTRLPQVVQGDPPDYPMNDNSSFGQGTTDADTDSGDGVTVMMQKLGGTGYLPRTERPGGFDSDVTQAIKDLQEDAGLTQSGNMNPDTWDALFDVTTTGINLKNSFIHPLAQKSKVRQWLRTANGSIAGHNPTYDPSVEPVDRMIDYGAHCELNRARRNAKGIIQASDDDNLAGTITLTSDVFAGDHDHGDESPTLLSRLDINAGMNCYLKNVSDALLHVSVVNVSGSGQVALGVDMRARNASELGAVIARRIESRQNPARQWKRQHLSRVNFRQIEASVDFGVLWNKVDLDGDLWNIVPIFAGDAGQVSRVRIKTTSTEAAFCVAFFAQKVSRGFMASTVGNPFDTNSHGESKWTNAGIQNAIDRDRSLLAAFGDADQPGGYHPRAHTNGQGVATDAPITGLMLEDAGFDYHTFDDLLVYMAIYPDRDCALKPQRILWAVEESDA